MVQANELRIGNRFIREIHNQRGLEYDHYFVLTEELMGKLFSHDTGWALQDLFPVPLTGQELIDCGFKKYSHNTGYSIGSDELDEKCDEYTLGKLSVMDWGNGFILSNSFSFDLRIELKNLHQLQNLVFALTSKELNVQMSEPKAE